MDSRNFIYAPQWVKVVALTVLAGALVVSVIVGLHFIGQEDRENWILVSMSVGQIAASGIVIALVVFFSERDVNVFGLQKRAESFFLETFPRACSFIDFPIPEFEDWKDSRVQKWRVRKALDHSRTRIRISHMPGQIDTYYHITWESGHGMVIRLQVNVGEVVVSYYLPAESESQTRSIGESLEWAFSRFRDVSGYKATDWYFSTEAFDGNTYASIHLTRDFGSDFLEDERKKLFVANDIAATTRGIMKECREKGIAMQYPQ